MGTAITFFSHPISLVVTMAKSRQALRREVEAAEAQAVTKKTASKTKKTAATKATKKRKAAKPRTKRAREQMQRRRLVWVVYSSTMREEGRFLFYEKEKAEELLETLLAKGKRKYFMQPLKEALNSDGTPVIQVASPAPEVDDEDDAAARADVENADDVDVDAELDLDDDGGDDLDSDGDSDSAEPPADS